MRRKQQGDTYKIILNFLKLDPQLSELGGQELGEVEAGGQGVGGRRAQQQQEQDGHGCAPGAGPHAVGKGCFPLLQLSDGFHRRV